ncbi:CheY-like superfamily [Venturia nashicola]|uniref:histidine kinase n=1 Tax=Venturia nashicola TaxID=86259 RepID=A0A4Z1PE02_9PEZI|nr:CheY-like superfamily [Venturia nashicola]
MVCSPSTANSAVLQTRDQEFSKYYHPDNNQALQSSVPSSSHDVALTALAQLGALRLNAKRCMISLFDRTQQYVIAEATRTLSLRSDSVYEKDDQLWIGCAVLPKENGICTLVIDLPVNASSDDPESENCGACIIPDLSKDTRFHDRAFVTGTPHARFYVGAPIKSPRGIHIGSYCILDDRPRHGISRTELFFLKDAADAVMVHLELTWAREERQRGERLIQGLGSFHEGMSTLRNQSIPVASPGLDDRIDTLSSWENRQSVSVGADGDISMLANTTATPTEALDMPALIESCQATILPSPLTEIRGAHLPVSDKSLLRQPANRGTSFESGRIDTHSSTISNEAIYSHNLHLKDALLPTGVKSTFARAANVIRESVEVEGVIFFDASAGSPGGLVHASKRMEDSSDASEYPLSTRIRTQAQERRARDQSTSSSDVFAFSTPTLQSVRGDATPDGFREVEERMIQRLLKRYPKGKVFLFRADGSVDPGDKDVQDIQIENIQRPIIGNRSLHLKAKVPLSRRDKAEFLLDIFPGARCIALTPLWDFTRERWFSLGIVWTRNPRRILNVESDLSYLTAFGNSIMAEISRLDSVAAKKAKADLLGSISHELRSPLHGILASVELLEDSSIVPFQASLINSIDICGRTLLDTIDHLLDYSKINHVSEHARHSRRAARLVQRPKATGPLSVEQATQTSSAIYSDVDLGAITEEVIVAVSVGHEIKVPIRSTQSITSDGALDLESNDQLPNDTTPPLHPRPKIERRTSQFNHVTISIDISNSSDWKMCTEVGAWRRIVMNLYGNSLKYCEQGFINVTLRSEPMESKDGLRRSMTILNVTDSGKGMSEEYLRNKLFKPFAQENPLAPGTGLGLSIIRQIILLLGGDIIVRSLQDVGTDILVRIPMVHSQQSFGDRPAPLLDEILMVREKTRGLAVCLLGMPEYPTSEGKLKLETGIDLGLWDHKSNLMRSTLESLCTNWFGMEVAGAQRKDIYLIGESSHNFADITSGQLLNKLEDELKEPTGDNVLQVIVLCKTVFSATNLQRTFRSQGRQAVVFISQPCGPRKLAKALMLVLEKRADILSGKPDEDGPRNTAEANRQRDSLIIDNDYESIFPVEPIRSTVLHFDHDQTSTSQPVIPEAQPHLQTTTKTHHLEQESATLSQLSTATGAHSFEPFLLVDDNPINLQVLSMYCKKNRYAFATASDGLEAYDAFQTASPPFKTVFMDVSMPVMDGLTSTRNIRTFEHENKLTPCSIIVLTGLGSASVQQEAYSSGANLLLVKPVRLKEIQRVLAEIAEEKSKPDKR